MLAMDCGRQLMREYQDRPQAFLDEVILPALAGLAVDADAKAASQLLLGTAIQESNLHYRRQLGDGPARGLFQMEPATHNDIWTNYLAYQAGLAAKVRGFLDGAAQSADALETNDRYAAAMARVHYRRVPAALPPVGDINAMGAYWKQYYNTPAGHGTAAQFVTNWRRYFP